MAASGRTVNYDLGIYNQNDTCSYLQTFNQNMTDIDRVCKETETLANEAKNVAGSDHEAIDALQQSVISLQNTLTAANQDIKTLQSFFTFRRFPPELASSFTGGEQPGFHCASNMVHQASISLNFGHQMNNKYKLNIVVQSSPNPTFENVVVQRITANPFKLNVGLFSEYGENGVPTKMIYQNGMYKESVGICIRYGSNEDQIFTESSLLLMGWDGTYTWFILEAVNVTGTTYRERMMFAETFYF